MTKKLPPPSLKLKANVVLTHPITGGDTKYHWAGIAYGNGVYVAVSGYNTSGTYHHIAISEDGENWEILPNTITNEGSTAINWTDVCYGDGKFVACAGLRSNTYLQMTAYSTDGRNWTAAYPGYGYHYYHVTYGGGYFVITSITASGVNVAGALYSTNGISWSRIENSGSAASLLDDAVYGNGIWLNFSTAGYGTNGTVQYTSNITKYPFTGSARPFTSRIQSGCYGNGKFIVIDQSINVAYSSDGISWSTVTLTYDKAYDPLWLSLKLVAYGDGKFVIIGIPQTSAQYTVDIVYFISEDGVNWETNVLQENLTSASLPLDICYGDGKFVAVCKYS